jgi:ubiquinone/menaquinone biosynthesis methyltransferase
MGHKSYKLSDQAARETFGRAESKREYNRLLFSTVAPRYNVATRVLSFGRDQAWKRTLLEMCGESLSVGSGNVEPGPGAPGPPLRILDIACGTGDLTLALAIRFPDAEIVGIDLNGDMLAEARGRLAVGSSEVSPAGSVQFIEGDMSSLPFSDDTFDLVTAGYALRNAPDLSATLGEIRRVLSPTGVLGVLEFSRSHRPAVSTVSGALLLFWGNLWGLLLHGDGAVYGYIARSLAHFPDRRELARLLADRGFSRLDRRLRMFGLLEITVAAG